MSPERADGRSIGTVVSNAGRRARLIALAEAAAWGAAAAAIWPIAGVLLATSVVWWRWQATGHPEIIRALERAQPEARNLFVTADELERGVLTATPAVRQRVLNDAASLAHAIDLRRAYPIAPVVRAAASAATAWAIVFTLAFIRGPLTRDGGEPLRADQSRAASKPAPLRVSVRVEPPGYTGLAPSTVVDPEQLQAIEGATLEVSIETSAPGVTLEHDGGTRALVRDASGRFVGRLQATKTGYLLVAEREGGRRMIPVVVAPDALPSVRVTVPGRDLVFGGGNPRITFDARATDDFGLRSLVLRYTKVSGSGEQFEFHDGEIPLRVARANPREWTGTASRTLADLELKDGDMLVYRAVASDARPGDGSGSSDAFFIEISKLGAAAGDAFTLPEEETRYALSQQMLIVKTERLHQRRRSLSSGDLAEAALNLAVEQRMIRAEFVFMLGGEIEDEEVEAQQSTELQEGRLQNRGQRDLRAATIAMSQAEKLLTGANTADALVAERAAVAALQRAFSKDRYILRALATRNQLDAARRLTGNLEAAGDWRRSVPDVAANRRAALLQDLLRGIAALEPATFHERALVLAEEAIRIDPAAATLRQAATELQRAAGASDVESRSRAVAAAASAAAAEARRAHADAPLASPSIAPALGGAFSDALASNARSKDSRPEGGRR